MLCDKERARRYFSDTRNFQRSRERNRVKNEVLSYEGLSHGANRLFAALSKFLQFIISPKRDKCRKTQIGCQKISVIDIGRRKTIFAALSFYRRCALSKWHTRPCLECAFQQAPRYQEINPIWMILICNRIFFKRSLKIPFPTKNLRRKRIIFRSNSFVSVNCFWKLFLKIDWPILMVFATMIFLIIVIKGSMVFL